MVLTTRSNEEIAAARSYYEEHYDDSLVEKVMVAQLPEYTANCTTNWFYILSLRGYLCCGAVLHANPKAATVYHGF